MPNFAERPVEELSAYRIDATADLEHHPGRELVIATVEPVTDFGASYTYVEIGYARDGEIEANRCAAIIEHGKRTEPAYWTIKAGEKLLTAHAGTGEMVVTNPRVGTTRVLSLNPFTTPEVKLPPGCYYTIRSTGAVDALVISGYYEPPVVWETDPRRAPEVAFDLSETIIRTADGTLATSTAFRERVARDDAKYEDRPGRK